MYIQRIKFNKIMIVGLIFANASQLIAGGCISRQRDDNRDDIMLRLEEGRGKIETLQKDQKNLKEIVAHLTTELQNTSKSQIQMAKNCSEMVATVSNVVGIINAVQDNATVSNKKSFDLIIEYRQQIINYREKLIMLFEKNLVMLENIIESMPTKQYERYVALMQKKMESNKTKKD